MIYHQVVGPVVGGLNLPAPRRTQLIYQDPEVALIDQDGDIQCLRWWECWSSCDDKSISIETAGSRLVWKYRQLRLHSSKAWGFMSQPKLNQNYFRSFQGRRYQLLRIWIEQFCGDFKSHLLSDLGRFSGQGSWRGDPPNDEEPGHQVNAYIRWKSEYHLKTI